MLDIFFAIVMQYLKKFSIFRKKVRLSSNCGILNNKYSIMCQTGKGRQVERPQKIDNDEIVQMYGRY